MSLNPARYIVFLSILLVALAGAGLAPAASANSAKQIFKQLKPAVYQIRMIDLASGEKNSIGSGFSVTREGHIVTNFHVVSSYVHEPKKYRIELLDNDEQLSEAELINFDVVHDLAILKSSKAPAQTIALNPSPLLKGDRIYAMGNPLDLGMTIIEGTYNGLVHRARFPKILFSGSLNAGMSGGPATDEHGKLIGVNVSKGEEQISFLVPASLVQNLIDESVDLTKPVNFQETVRNALFEEQDAFFSDLLQQAFRTATLGQLEIPGKISNALKCWGHQMDEKDMLYASTHQHCSSEDDFYISDDFSTGSFGYDIEWLSRQSLNYFQFFQLIEQRFTHKSASSGYQEEHISEYRCHTDHLAFSGHSWKASTCLRNYKQYAGLYDALFLIASVDDSEHAALLRMSVSGISQQNALKLFAKMVNEIQWKH